MGGDNPDAAGVSWMHPSWSVLPSAAVPVSAEEMDEQTEKGITAIATDTLGSSATVRDRRVEGISRRRAPPDGPPDSVLVLGSRGLGGFTGLLLGSVSQECVEYATCPVVVVRTDRIIGADDVILVGTDASEVQGGRRPGRNRLPAPPVPVSTPSTRGAHPCRK